MSELATLTRAVRFALAARGANGSLILSGDALLDAQAAAEIIEMYVSDLARDRENGKMGGRPRSKKKRCPCGEMTKRRAEARGHLTPEGTCRPVPKKKEKISEQFP